MMRRLLLGVAAMIYSRAVVSLVQLVLVPTLALSWGLPLYGQWLMLTTIPMFLGASDLGFSTTATMRLVAEVARGEFGEAQCTYRAARRMVMILTAIVLVLCAVTIAALPPRLLAVPGAMGADEARRTLALIGAYGLLTLQGQLFLAVGRATGRTAHVIAIDSTTSLCEGLAIAGVVLAGGRPVEAAMAWVLVRAGGVAALFILARRAAPWMRLAPGALSGRIREMVRPALAAMAIPLAQAIYLQGSGIAVGFAAGVAAIPLVTSLRTLSRLGLQAALVGVVPLMPEYAAAHANGDRGRGSLIAGALATGCLAMGVGYALVIAVFGRSLLHLWTGGSIIAPQSMVTLTALGIVASVLWNPLADLLISINRHESFSVLYCLGAIGTVLLTVVLVRMIGVTGAALANLLLEAAMAGIVLRALARHGGRIAFGQEALASLMPRLRAATRAR
jgi:O-antigen/teichoic acid export membrane protein